jgi:threonine synthase
MFSLLDANIFNIAIEGVFDDCQDIVKAVSNDLPFKKQLKIGTVNSINWARLLAQVVYYFAGYFQAKKLSPKTHISFAVPSGNFGNVCAAHVARMMGLPIHQLIVATNENNVLDEFFKTGIYRVRSSQHTHETSSPSMDISKASNFERFIFDLLDRDGALTNKLFSTDIDAQGFFDLSADPRFQAIQHKFGFTSGSSTHQNRLETIKDVYRNYQEIVDPHTADGLQVAKTCTVEDEVVVVLETALPIKFAATITEALGIEPSRPKSFEGIESLPKRVVEMPVDLQQVKDFLLENVT